MLAGFLLVLVIGAAVGRHVALRRPVPSLRSKTSLAVLLAIATPIGLLLYAAAGRPSTWRAT